MRKLGNICLITVSILLFISEVSCSNKRTLSMNVHCDHENFNNQNKNSGLLYSLKNLAKYPLSSFKSFPKLISATALFGLINFGIVRGGEPYYLALLDDRIGFLQRLIQLENETFLVSGGALGSSLIAEMKFFAPDFTLFNSSNGTRSYSATAIGLQNSIDIITGGRIRISGVFFAYIKRIDRTNNNVIWAKLITFEDEETGTLDILQKKDTNILAQIFTGKQGHTILLELDVDGNLIKNISLAQGIGKIDAHKNLYEDPEGYIYLCNASPRGGFIVDKLNPDLSVLWARELYGNGFVNDTLTLDIVRDADNEEFIFVMSTAINLSGLGLFILDRSGNSRYSENFLGFPLNDVTGLYKSYNNTILFIGTFRPTGPGVDTIRYGRIQLADFMDSLPNSSKMLWAREILQGTGNSILDINNTDHDIAFVGGRFVTSYEQAFAGKVNSEGLINNCNDILTMPNFTAQIITMNNIDAKDGIEINNDNMTVLDIVFTRTKINTTHSLICLEAPTSSPTNDPTIDPTSGPTNDPTSSPTNDPTIDPTSGPTNAPTSSPTPNPTDPTHNPTSNPTMAPTLPTLSPTSNPTLEPTNKPTSSKHNKDDDDDWKWIIPLFISLAALGCLCCCIFIYCCICLRYTVKRNAERNNVVRLRNLEEIEEVEVEEVEME